MDLAPRLTLLEAQASNTETIAANHETGGIWKIGDVKQSFLSVAQFIAEHDNTWVLCDGQTDITGSDLHATTGWTTTPDVRGRFLRAKDHGAGVNPDGDIAEGATQAEATKPNGLSASTTASTSPDGSHNHNQAHNSEGPNTTGGWDGSEGPYLAQRGSLGDSYYRLMGVNSVPNVALGAPAGSHSHPVSASTTLSGDNETRPVCTTLNMYIKINREPS